MAWTGSSPLTLRETDVLRVAQSGITMEQIAEKLSLSPVTVRNYPPGVGFENDVGGTRERREHVILSAS